MMNKVTASMRNKVSPVVWSFFMRTVISGIIIGFGVCVLFYFLIGILINP